MNFSTAKISPINFYMTSWLIKKSKSLTEPPKKSPFHHYALIDTSTVWHRLVLFANDFTIIKVLKGAPQKFFRVLRQNPRFIREVQGVIVIKGPGEFSAIRQGVTIGNTLSWALAKPSKGISIGDHPNSGKFESGKFIEPIYNRPPNIGGRKKAD